MRNKQMYLLIMIISIAIILLIGSSYALLKSTSLGTNPYVMNVGNLEVNFLDNKTNALTLENAYPMDDNEGMEQSKTLEFTIVNNGNLKAVYDVYIEETSTDIEFKDYIKFASSKNNEEYTDIKVLGDNKYIEEKGIIDINEEVNYKVKLWLSEDAGNEYMNQEFFARIVVETFQYREATFLPGSEFNVKIKKLAGTDTSISTYGYTVIDNNIIEIKRANTLPSNIILTNDNILSTIDSEEPIYGWFDNGILYYYTYAFCTFMNIYSHSMFRSLAKVTSIDLHSINTSKVIDMSFMFSDCCSLYSLNVSDFNTGNVSNMQQMFDNCNSIKELDISSFNMSNLSSNISMYNFIRITSLLKLKTPKTFMTNIQTIYLRKTMYDSNGNAYTILDSTSPTETWLYSEPQ